MEQNGKFFIEKQKEMTKIKLEIYKSYIEKYSIILLMQFWKLFILDLFCWPWVTENWEKWSPLLLIDILNKLLENSTLLKKQPNVCIFLHFNDENEDYFKELNENLKNYTINPKVIIRTTNKDFDWISKNLKQFWSFKFNDLPKFFFLDPFAYSIVWLDKLKSLFIWNTEILLFCPLFDVYRFIDAKNVKNNESHKTRKFIETFTENWLKDKYDSIYDLWNSIRKKLKMELKTDCIKYVLLDNWWRKNALFHITNHHKWCLEFIKVARKLWDYWMWIDVKYKEKVKIQSSLFEAEKASWDGLLNSFEKFLLEILKEKRVSNREIIKIAVINWFLPKEACNILKKNENKLNINYTTNKNKGFYISENNINEKIKCYITLKSN